jgi:hypothetical protein
MIPVLIAVPFEPPRLLLIIFSYQNSATRKTFTFFEVYGNFLHIMIAMNIFNRPAHFQAIDHENFQQLKDR